MGAAASFAETLSDEKEIALYEELRKEYDRKGTNGKSETENFIYYKRKYEALLESAGPGCAKPVVYCVGDIVNCGTEDGGEGIIMDETSGGFLVDVGRRQLVELPASQLTLVLSGLEYEVGDKVQVRPVGLFTFFTGWVTAMRGDRDAGELVYDVEMAGDEDDVERNVSAASMRKLLSHRLVRKRFKKIVNTVIAANKFATPTRPAERRASGDAKVQDLTGGSAGAGAGAGAGADDKGSDDRGASCDAKGSPGSVGAEAKGSRSVIDCK